MAINRTRSSPPSAPATRASRAPSAPESAANPVSPRASTPGFNQSSFEPGARSRARTAGARASTARTRPTSNGFVTRLSGRNPPVSAGGILTQLKQASATAQLALSAAASVASGGRAPPDFAVDSKLRSLSVTALTTDTDKVSHANYFSQIPGVKPEQAYAQFVNNPNAVFGAGDLKVRPAVSKLQDGQRLMLEQAGSPSVWFPIEVHLDPVKHQVNILTLDGHPLRGTNQFTFADDGKGGTQVNQLSAFQLSSKAVQLGMGSDDLERQHSTWGHVHAKLFEHFYPGT